jgi:hypothetical protein
MLSSSLHAGPGANATAATATSMARNLLALRCSAARRTGALDRPYEPTARRLSTFPAAVAHRPLVHSRHCGRVGARTARTPYLYDPLDGDSINAVQRATATE